MAWQMGNKKYQKVMRKKAERQEAVNAFVNDINYNKHIREIIQMKIGRKEKPMSLTNIHKTFVMFQEETAPDDRVPK